MTDTLPGRSELQGLWWEWQWLSPTGWASFDVLASGKLDEVFTLGETFCSLEHCGAIRQFDEAIRLDESNPVPLYNKGLTLIQMNQFEAHNAQKLFESALAVDPTCMVALMRLSELKLQLAASFDQAQAVVDMLGGAMQNCRDKDELVELSTVRAMAVAQLAAARDVGLTSFQM